MKRLGQLAKKAADFIEPMDCAPVSKLPDGSQWLFEIKLDGYRAVSGRPPGLPNLPQGLRAQPNAEHACAVKERLTERGGVEKSA